MPTDDDAFLTLLESKLRNPFSSLEVVKLIESEPNFLVQTRRILHRTEKVTQLRVLTGLLGLSDDDSPELQSIIQTAQEAPKFEEWVRVIAGLVEGSTSSEGADTVRETCREILNRVHRTEEQSATIDEDTEYRLGHADVDPLLLPYRYHLVRSEEEPPHWHFRVHEDAAILQEPSVEPNDTATTDPRATTTTKHHHTTTAIMPGLRSTTTTTTSHKRSTARSSGSSSLFLRTGRGGRGTGRGGVGRGTGRGVTGRGAVGRLGGGGTTVVKPKPAPPTALRVRKRAQDHLGTGRRNRVQAASTKTPRMKMMSVDEVQQVQQKPQQPKQSLVKQALKRKAEAAAASSPPTKKKPKDDVNLAAAALNAYQATQQQQTPNWRELLQNANKITDPDRQRVELFFENHHNPDPAVTSHKVKLREERKVVNGRQLKETYYLELNYLDFTCQQSMKTKYYD